MVVRDFHCPQCMSSFKTESGMKWHLTHKHEIPVAIEAISKDYKSKLEEANRENSDIKDELQRFKGIFEAAQMGLSYALTMNKELSSANQQLNDSLYQLAFAVSVFRLEVKALHGIDLSDEIKDCLRECQAKVKSGNIGHLSDREESQKENDSPWAQYQKIWDQ